ncbi:TPR-like protein [Aulographum hederae CBS 113979]|uniref:TPR-like protein n=1 Tax=Aulographum hederae CBS 113979 TaxID=1176131 RepID=A0A6G1GXW9_9PEZI|nr:TPR-like protein [Aulographum hederae CBS 113979]
MRGADGTPPFPLCFVPFSRDPDFVERESLLGQIDLKLAVPGSRTALIGLGGVGKSQLAIEYAYRTRDRSPETWVFWIHASNAARFEQSYRDIADCIRLPERQDPKANIFQLMFDWLRDEKRGKWILILDNVDDSSFLFEAYSSGQKGQANDLEEGDSQPLVSYLPQCLNGAILVTTRNREAALKLVELRDIIVVDLMSEEEALVLLKKKLGHEDNDAAAELVSALEFMPLAIVQAAAYISCRAPRSSVRMYLEEFRKNDRKRESLLDFRGGALRRDVDAKNSVITTWQISFDHIRLSRHSAVELLSLMSFFDRQGIPESLLRGRHEHDEAQQYDNNVLDDVDETDDDVSSTDNDIDKDGDEFEADISTLRDYSFISIKPNGSSFEMHGQVQMAMRKWLEAHGQQERWKQQFVRNLCSEFPVAKYENWATCQVLFPHARSAATQKPDEQESFKMWATILYRAASYAKQIGNGAEAEKMSIASMKARKKLLGREHEDTLWSMSLVGDIYNLRGLWGAAESLFVQVMETRKSKLGMDHPDTLIGMANLASAYRNQGRWEKAESLEVQVMETFKSKLGADHPDTLTSMANLASTYRDQGRWYEAESLEVQVIETRKSKLGVDHPSTLTSMANLASTYRNQGRWEEAESLEVQVMETSKSKLGLDHPDTLSSMANLASTYRNQGRWEEAESLEVQVMETSKSKLGVDHPSTLSSMANLASTYRKQGRWEEAESLGVQLGVDHPDTLTSMNNLAFTFKGQGEEGKAIKLMEDCIGRQNRVLGPGHPHTKESEDTLRSWCM